MARLVGEANKASGKTGWSTAPDACQNLFSDMPCPGDPDAQWVETLVNHGIAAGCGGGNDEFATRHAGGFGDLRHGDLLNPGDGCRFD